MIEALSKLPQDAEIFEGNSYPDRPELNGIPAFDLYDREPVYHSEVWSCGSMAPHKRSIKKHVVVLEPA